MSEAILTARDVINKLVAILKSEGPILLSSVPDKLKPIDYRQYATGKLKAWLSEQPEFTISEDDRFLVLADGVGQTQPAPVAAAAAPEQNLAAMAEVRCMHAFAYMNFWTQNLKRLRNLGEFTDIKADALRDHVGHRLMQGLLLGQIKVVSGEDRQPQLVLDTGLQMTDGSGVYAVLGINSANTDGTKQFWAMQGFGSDSQADTTELGDWIRTHVTCAAPFDYSDLSQQIDRIVDMKVAVRAAAEAFLAQLDEERCPALEEGGRLSGQIADYESQWENLMNILESLPVLASAAPVSLQGLRDSADQEVFRSNLLRQALDIFGEVAMGIRGFFGEFGWDAGEDCTPMRDLAALQKTYGGNRVDTDLNAFAELLDIYRALRGAMASTVADEDFFGYVTVVTEHFRELPQFRVTSRLLLGTPEEERHFLNKLDEIQPLLNQYISFGSEAETAEEAALPENMALLAMALEGDREYMTHWPQYLKAALPEDPQLQALVVPGKEVPEAELTCYAAACRLWDAGCREEAERYWILGLLHEWTLCAPALLKCYREADRSDGFAPVWTRYHDKISCSSQDESFWFGTVCQNDPEQALSLCRDNMHLQYQPGYLSNLITAAENLGRTELAQTFRERLERFRAHAQPNAFEAAVIADDREQIAALARPELLRELGYDEQLIESIRESVEADEYPAGTNPYEIGSRLYTFQENLHCLAEQWLWRGVSRQNRGSYGILMLLLTDERRWGEVIRLYETYVENQKRFEECRRFYLIACYYDSPLKAQPAILENLQDVLTVMNVMPSFRERFADTARETENALYTLLLKLHTATAADPYLWSVICEDRSLRDRVNDRPQLEALGLDVAAVGEAYRSGTYPHGRDAVSVARRLFALAGNLSGAAETTARMAGAEPSARKLLWTIYDHEQNETALYELLAEDDALRREHYTQYMGFVYARGEYATFLDLFEESGDLSEQLMLQRATAELTLGRAMSDSAENCAEVAASAAPEICLALLRSAAAGGQDHLVTELACACFDRWLPLRPDQLREMVTCGGAAGQELLERIQQAALERQCLELAVYIQNVLRVGDVRTQSEQLYQLLQEQLTSEDHQEQMLCLQKLQRLYPEQAEELSVQAAAVSVRAILLQSQSKDKQETAEKLEAAIASLEQDPAVFDVLVQLLKGSEYCQDYRVYTAIRKFARQLGRSTDALLFLHQESRGLTVKSQFRDYMIDLYWHALIEDRFPNEIAREAEAACLRNLKSGSSVRAALNAAMIEQLLGRPLYAHAVLNHLATITDSQSNLEQFLLTDLGLEELPDALRLPDPLPDSLQLFEQVLEQGSEAQVMDFLHFCRTFAIGDMGAFQALRNLGSKESLSDQQSIQAMDLLFSDPDREDYWDICAHIPFDVSEAGKAVFLHLCCQKAPGHWEKYVKLCETLSATPERLSNALLAWSGGEDALDFRHYLENKLEKYPSYLQELNDPESMYRITENICRQAKKPGSAMNHAQLRAVSMIAVCTGELKCLILLRQELGYLLFGSKSDLGVAVLSRLLLAERFEEARAWLADLHQSLANTKYRPLVDSLAGYSVEQLHAWLEEPSSRMFLELILPEGNQPNIKRVDSITARAISEGREQEAAAVLKRILQVFPDDYVTAYELLELCKTGFDGSLPMLHFSLVTLARIAGDKDNADLARIYDDCSSETHLLALAALNQLLIHTKTIDTVDDGWNFTYSTAQALESMNLMVRDPGRLAAMEQRVRDSLDHQPPEIFKLRVQAWLANITGNWTAYLEQAYQLHQQPGEIFIPADIIDSPSMTRSVLRILAPVEIAEVSPLLKWLSQLAEVAPLSKNQKEQVGWAVRVYRSKLLTTAEQAEEGIVDRILRFPLDNGRLSSKMVPHVLRPLLTGEPEQLNAVAELICSTGSKYAMYCVYTLAGECFGKSRDGAAWALFAALYRVGNKWHISHTFSVRLLPPDRYPAPYYYNVEEYQTKMRICGAFYGVENCVNKLGNGKLNSWTIINLVLCLASTRPSEIKRLESYMHPGSVQFAEWVCMILKRSVSDEDKLALLWDTNIEPLDRYYLAKMLRFTYPSQSAANLYYLKSMDSFEKAGAQFSALYASLSDADKRSCKRQLLCQGINSWSISGDLDLQKDPEAWERTAVTGGAEGAAVFVAPYYVAHLTPAEPDAKALEQLRQQYQQLTSGSYGQFAEKERLSAEIYRHVIGAEESVGACYRALLNYSVDRFYALLSDGTQQSSQQAFQLLIALMETDIGHIQRSTEYEALVEMVNAVGAMSLIKSYTQIRQMAEQFALHSQAFAKMRGMILDTVVFRDLGILFEVLAKLEKDFGMFSHSATDKLIMSLSTADSSISTMSDSGSASVKNHMQRMIRAELTVLSRRAVLEVRLLNQGVQAHNGNLTGVIINRGTVKAENLTLQAFCGVLNSDQYTLRQLLPNENAIFEIPYECPLATERLEGRLDLVGQSGETMVSAQCQISLELGETSGEALPFSAYTTERPGFVYDKEKGLNSKGFFGRYAETERLRQLVAGESFADFHSAVVYGVRRTGKTYLLEYFKSYVSNTHPECFCVRIDVQETDVTIHSVFVKSILKAPQVLEALEDCPDRDMFVAKWEQCAAADADMDPNLITVFYRELFQLTQKGMFLIIDEIDRLFKRLTDDHQEQLLNNLLSAMSGMLDNAERKAYLQLIICGSNWLMHYASVGYDMQQLFHRFGDYKISVGRLPKEDVLALLGSVDINYAEGTQEMIWEFTGGLVWFVKLLANAAIRRAKLANRSCIYPADVFYSLPDVVNDLNCEQFYEGCLSGSLERQMIDAMQSIAYRKDIYLPVKTLCDLLQKEPQLVEQALTSLIRFEIAERHAVDPNRIRFGLDIYRRYFRTKYSPFTRVPEEAIAFVQKGDSGGAITYTAVTEAYDDDEEV